MPNSNETFWVIFKQCVKVEQIGIIPAMIENKILEEEGKRWSKIKVDLKMYVSIFFFIIHGVHDTSF